MNSNWKRTIKKQKEMRELKPYYLIKDWMEKNLTKRQQGIVEFLILHGETTGTANLTAKELAAYFRVSPSSIYRDLRVLREKEILIKSEDGGEDLTFDKVLPDVAGVI